MDHANSSLLLSLILEILEMMVESGAEIYRVEESATRALEAYQFGRVDIYATTSNIILSVESKDGTIKTHTRRIRQITNDIERVHLLNDLIRRISSEGLEPASIKKEIKKIKAAPRYPAFLNLLFYGIIASSFSLFFGERAIFALLFSFGIGLITGLWVLLFEKVRGNKFLVKFVCSFSACFLAAILKKLGLIETMDFIIIGNIMALIPGTGLTNSLRDLFTGDSISGVLRLIEASLLAFAIAGGYIITNFLFGGMI